MRPAVNAWRTSSGRSSGFLNLSGSVRFGWHLGGAAFRELFRRQIERPLRVSLALGGFVIAARIIMHGAVVIAVCGAIGAGEIFDAVGQIGIGIAQALRIAGITKA